MGANSFFIDILLFGELMGPLSVIRYPLSADWVRETGESCPICAYRCLRALRRHDVFTKAEGSGASLARAPPAERAGAEGLWYAARRHYQFHCREAAIHNPQPPKAAVKLKNLKNPRLRRSRPPSPLNLLNQPAFGGPNPLNPGRLCRPFYFRLLITRKSWGVRKGV